MSTTGNSAIDPAALHRVLVVGSSCSGKSTFARELGRLLDQRWIELDELHWGPDWTEKPAAEFHRLAAQAAAGERWIIDGNYSGVRELLWPRATAVIWLNYPFAVVMRRALRRTTFRALSEERLWHGNRESIRRSFLSRDSILVWVVKSFARRRRQFTALRVHDTYPQLRWIEFSRPSQAAVFLQLLAQRARPYPLPGEVA